MRLPVFTYDQIYLFRTGWVIYLALWRHLIIFIVFIHIAWYMINGGYSKPVEWNSVFSILLVMEVKLNNCYFVYCIHSINKLMITKKEFSFKIKSDNNQKVHRFHSHNWNTPAQRYHNSALQVSRSKWISSRSSKLNYWKIHMLVTPVCRYSLRCALLFTECHWVQHTEAPICCKEEYTQWKWLVAEYLQSQHHLLRFLATYLMATQALMPRWSIYTVQHVCVLYSLMYWLNF